MADVKDGGPAFPVNEVVEKWKSGLSYSEDDAYALVTVARGGMSLRDYFAGQALTGIVASYSGADVKLPDAGMAALKAYDYADAMLKARAEGR